MLLKGIPEVQSSNRPASAAEMALIRIAHAADLPTLDEALKSLADAPQSSGAPAPRPSAPPPASPGNGGASAVAASFAPVTSGGGQTMRLVETQPSPTEFVAPPQPVEEPPAVPVKSLEDIAALAETHRDRLFKISLKQYVRLVRLEPGRLDVGLTGDAPKTLLGDLKSRLETWTGRRWMVALSREEGGQTLAEAEAAKRNDAILDAKSDPAVAAILARFPGAKIIDVRIPNVPETEAGDADLPVEAADDDETDF
jgi:DNA polymerase-3 subunit gamma/tau